MTAGSSHKTHLSRQLSSDRMSMLLDTVKITFDMVILDTSPCGLIADTSEIAELAECAVMVVRRDYSSRSQILDGTRFLTDSKLPLVGAILNGTQKSSRNGYDYGYGYGNAYGYK
jgi:Mrp family chromosome partitioning ATPase